MTILLYLPSLSQDSENLPVVKLNLSWIVIRPREDTWTTTILQVSKSFIRTLGFDYDCTMPTRVNEKIICVGYGNAVVW